MDSESELLSLITLLISLNSSSGLYLSDPDPDSELTRVVTKTISFVSSMDFDSMPKPQSELISLTAQIVSLVSSTSDSTPESRLISVINQHYSLLGSVDSCSELNPQVHIRSLINQLAYLTPEPELISLIKKIVSLVLSMDSNSELKLITLMSDLMSMEYKTLSPMDLDSDLYPEFISLIIEIISLVSSMDLDSQPKPKSKLMSLVTQTISLFNSMDLDSLPKPLSDLISLVTQEISLGNSIDSGSEFVSLVRQTLSLEPEPELISLIRQIFCVVNFMKSKWKKLISLSPQGEVRLENGKFHLEEVWWSSDDKWYCFLGYMDKFSLTPSDSSATHFRCRSCNGEYHKDYEKAPVEIKHPLHPKYSLQLVLFGYDEEETRKCYCCDKDLQRVFYYCSACDYAMNIACVEKPPVLSIDHPKWHEHTLALFPSQVSFPCNLCALTGSTSCPFYICPPCDFVVHQSCTSLPRVIRISRHPHCISFTHCFDQGDWSCGVCRRKINNDYGGYSCIKDNCSYAAHSRCATQRNVWDGIELEGESEEETEEEFEPFLRISDGIILHFSHQYHYLRLDENASGDYDENKQCQACITPIYFGNFYSCLQCDFILHEACANLSYKVHHPIHPHLLTLVGGYDGVVSLVRDTCSACGRMCGHGFFYECGKRGCFFKLHVQCATISEPLVHGSHMHLLFLTSKPDEQRVCCVCKDPRRKHNVIEREHTNETFNCIECDFALCFGCATIPHKVKYKYDKHILTLSYGKETSHETYWCEACERKINPKERFYRCDEYCCVTLHIQCVIGKDLYTKPGSLVRPISILFDTISNNHMSRPICNICKERCPFKTVFVSKEDRSEAVACSLRCARRM